jgi:hypothetical protein
MDGAHGNYGGKIHAEFRWGNLKERDRLKDLEVDGRAVLKRILRK